MSLAALVVATNDIALIGWSALAFLPDVERWARQMAR